MTQTNQTETREQVCQDCEYQVLSVPIACELITTTRYGKTKPCSGILRRMMQTAKATCPHPDPAWAERWNAAELLPAASTIVGNVTTPVINTTESKTGQTRCQLGKANRHIDTAEIVERANARETRRGNSNRAFHVHRLDTQNHPARTVPDA